ncbi:MAG TPA: hypothetical protein VLJ21_04100 [Candidatus Binatia bacterium]|nr:hypothetical protein [Candidatus Binatia bacterium]
MKNSWLFVLAVALMLVAGCSAPSGPAPGSSPAPGSNPSEGSGSNPAMAEGHVELTDVPSEVLIGKPVMLKWRVTGDGDVKTAVVYSTKSHADVDEPTMMTYQSSSPKVALTGTAGDFETSFQFDEPIKVYVRAYAIVGDKTVWSDEGVVTIVTKMSAPATATDSSADTSGSTY